MKRISGKAIFFILCVTSYAIVLHSRPRNIATPVQPSPHKSVATKSNPTKTFPVPTKPVAQVPAMPVVPKSSTITIKNVITPKMASYQYCGSHSPEQFSVELNGQSVAPGSEKSIEITNNTLEATYHYSFAKGLYKGSKTCAVAVSEDIAKAEVHFSWHREPRVWLEKI